MPEIRTNGFTGEVVVITTDRACKPDDFVADEAHETDAAKCPFCPSNAHMITDPIYFSPDRSVRAIANLYPALCGHEVIIETHGHNKSPADRTDEEAHELMKAYRDRYVHHARTSVYVSLFRNHGKDAGASQSHPHSQIVPMPLIPPHIVREMVIIGDDGYCAYCDIDIDDANIVMENEGWIVFTPHGSKAAFEVWMVPKAHISNLSHVDDLALMGTTLRDILKRLKDALNDPAYNLMFYQMDDARYHMSIRIEPVTTTSAGFEKGTGVHINPVDPVMAAEVLRDAPKPLYTL